MGKMIWRTSWTETLPVSFDKRWSLHEEHEPGDKVLAGELDDLEESSEEREANDRGEDVGLDVVHDPELAGRLIEAVPLLDNERVVVAPEEAWDGADQGRGGNPQEGMSDLLSQTLSNIQS